MNIPDAIQLDVWSRCTTSGELVVKRNFWALFQHTEHFSFLSMHLAKTVACPSTHAMCERVFRVQAAFESLNVAVQQVHQACHAGLRGFGQGLLARTLTIAPGAAIQWYIYENVKAHLARP